MDNAHATLDALLADALARLADGAASPKSPWRNLALATADGERPGIRTVVLRRFQPSRREAEIHTDARSPKMATLRRNPFASLHAWDPESRIQLRLDGEIIVADEADTQAAWDALPGSSRSTYAGSHPPGTAIADPALARLDLPVADARAVFRLLRLRFDVLEYLSLEHGGHKRARFEWPDGTLKATWLVP